jgi:alpha-galactosidase
LQKLGYERIEMDGGWWDGCDTGTGIRNSTGFMQFNQNRFPDGNPVPMVQFLASEGFKYHWYFDAGKRFCNRDTGASEGFEKQDVALAAWLGVSGVKVDACGVVEDPQTIVSRWQGLLNATGKPILFANCRNGCETGDPWSQWCADLTNQWRTSSDIQETWSKVMYNLDTLGGRGAFGAPHRWNYPDSLETGNLANTNEDATNFALWCVASSPLILGHQIPNQTAQLLNIVSNEDAIKINQQYAGNSGDRVQVTHTATGDAEVWAKPLTDGGAVAVVAFNRNATSNVTVVIDFANLPFPSHTWSAAHPRRTERANKAAADAAQGVGPSLEEQAAEQWWTASGSLAEQEREWEAAKATSTEAAQQAASVSAHVYNVWKHATAGDATGSYTVTLSPQESAFLTFTPTSAQ